MGSRAIHVVETAGDTTGLREFANGADSGLIIPQGTTAERESGATAGTIRYNTSLNAFEFTTGSDVWITLTEGGLEGLIGDAAADGSTKGVATFDGTEFSASSGVISIGTLNATSIADGSVTDAEFQYIGTLTSDAQTQIDSKATTANRLDEFAAPTAAIDINGQVVSDIKLQNFYETDVAVSSSTGVVSIDLANGNTGALTLTENVTDIDFTNVPADGVATFTLKVTQDASTAYTVAINAITVNGGSDVTPKTVGGGGFTMSSTLSGEDILSFIFFDNSTPLLNALQDFS
jgi:hypothetical protein